MRFPRFRSAGLAALFLGLVAVPLSAEEFSLNLRSQQETPAGSGEYQRQERAETWPASATAVIVCDVWDLHHCRTSLHRIEEFLPRMNQVLIEARRKGATIIHSPSDCMAAYTDHPARKRAIDTPLSAKLPTDIHAWCSRLPSEEKVAYPIDQSDGGGDDDPQEQAKWSAKLEALGRNPAMPWKSQSSAITIDAERDYITDRGEEVWSILEARGIKHVILVGVHSNMCVLGRPFGLRQMVKNGRQAVCLRDLTDTMYNPSRRPYVDHFTANDLIISHIERYVCPTITSDQIVGGKPFRWQADQREHADIMAIAPSAEKEKDRSSFTNEWALIDIPATWKSATRGVLDDHVGPAWYRCVVRIPKGWAPQGEAATLELAGADPARCQAWLNGQVMPAAKGASGARFTIPAAAIVADEVNLLVLRVMHRRGDGGGLQAPPMLSSGPAAVPTKLAGRWQFRLGDDPAWTNFPLPAKYGTSTEIVFEIAPR